MKKFFSIFSVCFLILNASLDAQNSDFVYIKDNKFMQGCDEFYPVVVNYAVEILGNSSTGYFIGPEHNYFNNNNDCVDEADGLSKIRAHLAMIKNMGFNTIRVCGLSVKTDEFATTGKLYDCISHTDVILNSPYTTHLAMIEKILDLAEEFNLKVILLAGGGGVDHYSVRTEYGNYLQALAQQFSEKTSFFAIDLYNEPSEYDIGVYLKTDTYQIAYDWYQAIRANTANQLVTIGLTGPRACVEEWDPSVLSVDFISYHTYIYDGNWDILKGQIKWFSEVTQKIWIIGETSFSGTDNLALHPYAEGTYQQQKDFAEISLDMTRDCGGKGYSRWQYQDVRYHFDTEPLSNGNYYGLINHVGNTAITYQGVGYTVDGTQKPAVTEIQGFDPFATGNGCPSYTQIHYYDPFNYGIADIQGIVYDPNGNRLPNAVITAYKYSFSGIELGSYYTYSEADGTYKAYSDHTSPGLIRGIKISATGLSVVEQWPAPSYFDAHLTNLSIPAIPNYPDQDVVIGANQNITWNTNTVINQNLILEPTAQLTITADVYFNEGKKLIVKPGATLTVDGGKLTTLCHNKLWHGVEVWGTTNQSQYCNGSTCFQGKAILINNATIENAYTAITNCNPAYQSTQSGGIILATETTFRNNRVSADFVPYSNYLSGTLHNELSYFVKCNFIRDAAINNNTAFVTFVDLKTIYKIYFYGCNFNDTYATNYNQQGTGIKSLDSYFKVIPYCNCSGNPCPTNCMEKGSFRNLAYGIWVQKAVTNNSYYVDNTNFYHCNRCIMNQGVNTAIMTQNYFEFQYPLTGSTYETGISIYSATGYTIEENQFTANTTNFTSTGVYIYLGGYEDNYVYKNWFHDNSVGISTYGTCRSSNGSTGLQFICNNFINSQTYDINTRAGGSNSGVRNLQGSSSLATGNVFTYCTGSWKNFYNQAPNTLNYYYYNGSLQDPVCNWPTYFWKRLALSNSCPSHLSGGGGGSGNKSMSSLQIQALEDEFTLSKNAMLSYQHQYEQLIDGGNTNLLSNEIDNSNLNSTWQLYNKLKNKTPYLSEKVIYKVSNKTNVLPNLLLFNILKQNPDVLKSGKLFEHLSDKQVPMQAWMIDTLNVFRSYITSRTDLEEKISTYAERKDNAGFKLIQDALTDTVVNHTRIKTWLNNMGTFYSDIMAINENMAASDYNTAEIILNSMPAKYNLEDDYALEYQWFVDLFGLLTQFHNSNKTIYQLDSVDLKPVKHIADNGYGCAKIYAENICRLYGYVYEPEFIENDEATIQNKSMIQDNPESQQSVNKEDNVECYPNPAKEWIVFKWETTTAENSIIITVANSLSSIVTIIKTDGIVGEKILDTNEWPIGIYYYKAEKNGQVVKSGKFVISR